MAYIEADYNTDDGKLTKRDLVKVLCFIAAFSLLFFLFNAYLN